MEKAAVRPVPEGVSERDAEAAGVAVAPPVEGQDPGRPRTEEEEAETPAALLDPLELTLSKPAWVAPSPAGPEARSFAGIDPLVSELVRAIAWGGDRRRGAARLELGGSRFGGASVVVHAEGRELRIEVEAPPHIDGDALAERLKARLESRGLVVSALTRR